MDIEKFILAVVTTNPKKVPAGIGVFHCDNREEMDHFAASLEAILDGIAHLLSEEVYIIVKH
ncbi:capping complex subunit for YIEGIA [Peribacillus sp. SCS-155]|uniref:capping complex subunit for YIEGIA n=1 Tax=Peribacillus sedimenti TaxID=3115297 RepID=UPI003906592F